MKKTGRTGNFPSVCILVPTYNNAATLADILGRIRTVLPETVMKGIIVVDDGCTDGSSVILDSFSGIEVVRHPVNRGKGAALRSGFKKAAELGYTHVVTLDSDGQHFPEDIPAFIAEIRHSPDTIIVGSRNLRSENMPGKNTFANRFSNFWFMLQTACRLDDTQTGFRAYPLAKLSGTALMTSRYEAELELLVLSRWKGTCIRQIPIRVYYPPEGQRVSHFRPVADFVRISILNTGLCVLALIYGYPSMLIRKICCR